MVKGQQNQVCQIISKSTPKIIMFSQYIQWNKLTPPPGDHVFQRIKSFSNLGNGWPNDNLCQIILKSAQQFVSKRFLKFILLVAMVTRIMHGTKNI